MENSVSDSNQDQGDGPVFLRVDDVVRRYGFSRTWFLDLVAEGFLPKPRRFGPRCTVWERGALDDALSAHDLHDRLTARAAHRRALKVAGRLAAPAGRVA